MDVLRASLPEACGRTLGWLARWTSSRRTTEWMSALHGASTTCTCGIGQTNSTSKGSVGCAVASFLAVLVSAATNKPVLLERCMHEASTDAWTIPMRFGPSMLVTA